MGKTVTFTADFFPYCVGDVIVLSDDEVKQIDKVSKLRKTTFYVAGAKAEVDSSAEADRQEAELKTQAVNSKEAEAKVAFEDAASAKADEQGVTDPTGRVPAGTSADDKLTTAAAAGKHKSN